MAEHPGKRSNPQKLAKEREAIRKSQAEQVSPAPPSTPELIFKALGNKMLRNKGRRMGFGPSPQKAGALVKGTRSLRNET